MTTASENHASQILCEECRGTGEDPAMANTQLPCNCKACGGTGRKIGVLRNTMPGFISGMMKAVGAPDVVAKTDHHAAPCTECDNPLDCDHQPAPKRPLADIARDVVADAKPAVNWDEPLKPFDPVAHRERLMTAMTDFARFQGELSDIMQSIRSGESFAIQAASEKAVALAIAVGQAKWRLLPLIRAARQDEQARDRAVGIHPCSLRPVPESVRLHRDSVLDVTAAKVLPVVMGGQGRADFDPAVARDRQPLDTTA